MKDLQSVFESLLSDMTELGLVEARGSRPTKKMGMRQQVSRVRDQLGTKKGGKGKSSQPFKKGANVGKKAKTSKGVRRTRGKASTKRTTSRTHSPFKRKNTLGTTGTHKEAPPAPPPRGTRQSHKSNRWKCHKIAAYQQRCVERKKRKGATKKWSMVIDINPTYKKKYNKAYKQWVRKHGTRYS